MVLIDDIKLRQILINLIENALKFTTEGHILFGYNFNNNEIQFFVEDTGIGISDEKQHIIFERFRQSDESVTRKYGGTGLGLSIAKGLTEIMGGKISLTSQLNVGSCFNVFLPCSRVESKQKNTVELYENRNYDWSDKSVLIVEDDEASCEYLKAVLQGTGILILESDNGLDALEIIKNTTIDIVLMDIQLPKMNGYETTIKIKEYDSKIPVIIQTAYAMSNEKQKSIDAGCDKYLTKPVDDEQLLFAMEQLLAK